MHTLWQDLRFSVRVLARHRGFAITSILVLALGIGVNAGIFGLINSLLLRPRASGPVAGELVGVHSLERDSTGGYRSFSYPNYADLRDASAGPFTSLAAHNMAMAGRRRERDHPARDRRRRLGQLLRDLRSRAGARADVHSRGRTARRAGLRRDRQPLDVGAHRTRGRHPRDARWC